MIWYAEKKRNTAVPADQLPDICGIRLNGYAESFRELARSFEVGRSSKLCDRRTLFEEERQSENRKVIAGHLKELADIMEQTAEEIAGLEPLEKGLWKKLLIAMRDRDVELEGACILPANENGRQISLRLRTRREGGIPAADLADLLEPFFGRKYTLSYTTAEWVDSESRTFLFVEQPIYMAFTGFARVVKSGEEISGDNISVLQSEKGTLSLLLSDGTGSGDGACRGSGWVLDLTEKLIENGYGAETALRLVNAAAVTMGDEIGHPTLDMCQIDLARGCCEFCKAGGAISFHKRGSEVEPVEGGQLPLGIFQDLEPHRKFLSLRDGDSIILMTDGVLDAFHENGYEESVVGFLENMDETGPQEMAEKLMQLAIFASGGNIRDDMTILVAMIRKNPV